MHPKQSNVEPFAEFADALSRLKSIGTLYPVTHNRSREASARLREAITLLTGPDRSLVLEVVREDLMLGSSSMPLTTRQVQALHSELDGLGIARLEIDPAASGEDLHRLAVSLRAASQRIQAKHSLQVVDFGVLPDSIRARFREFGRRVGRGHGAGSEQGTVEQVITAVSASMDASALEPKTRAACEDWVKDSLRKIVERVENGSERDAQNNSEARRRSLDKVLKLAGQTLEHALSEFLSAADGDVGLQRMFQSIEVATAVCEDPETARLMVEVLRESAEELLKEKQEPSGLEVSGLDGSDLERYELSIEELSRQLGALKPALGQMASLETEDRSETISILLAALTDAMSQPEISAILAQLKPLVAGVQKREEKATLLGGIEAFCGGVDAVRIDSILSKIAAVLGDQQSDLWIGAAASAAASRAPEELDSIWPHLANEVLRGSRATMDVNLSKALVQVGRLPKDRIEALMPRLLELSRTTNGAVSKFAFEPLREELAPFYAGLLRSQRAEAVGALLLDSLKKHPPQWRGGIVFQLFERCNDDCRGLLTELLARGALTGESAEIPASVGRLLAEGLAALPSDRAGEPWVVPAIEALGGFPTPQGQAALRRVLNERRNFFFPVWPGFCRAAARSALARSDSEALAKAS